MKLTRTNQVFNLFNTNGRRADVIEAYTIYLDILTELQEKEDYEWSYFPNSLNQFEFYMEAIKRSPEVFKNHGIFDRFYEYLQNEEYLNAFSKLDISQFKSLNNGKKLLDDLDSAIEARARHYTSNLVKLGFTYSDREITPIGKSYLNSMNLKRSELEEILPIDNTNLIILQQIFKLRIYRRDAEKYYSPILMCFYILLHNDSINAADCLNLIQLLTPEKAISPNYILSKIKDFSTLDFAREYINISADAAYNEIKKRTDLIPKNEFDLYFKNRKSSKPVGYYYEFYSALYNYVINQTQTNLNKLCEIYSQNSKRRYQLNKAFGYNTNIFNMENHFDNEKFLLDNSDNIFLNKEDFNIIFYEEYYRSKHYDQVAENSDTLRRIIEATGVISINNGVMGLEYKDVWLELFKEFDFANEIFVETSQAEYETYELNKNSIFYENISIDDILNHSEEKTIEILDSLQEDYDTSSIEETKNTLKNRVNTRFIKFIKENYPVHKVREILLMFRDRSKDSDIKRITSSVARIPTIFEYIVGIAWYHISEDEYNVFDSFNLTMTTDFIPVTHASGGHGDIIATYEDYVVMLEATLLDTHGQRRNELEPVTRHTVNLTAESAPKNVYTIYVANELDNNTISTWRAQAYSPLESTSGQKIEVDGINILPVTIIEYANFLKNDISPSNLVYQLNESIENNGLGYNWRDKVIENIMD